MQLLLTSHTFAQSLLYNKDKNHTCSNPILKSERQFIYKILYVCSTAFLLPFGTQMLIVVLLKVSYFLSIKALDIVYSIYTVSFNQIVYVSSVMIGFAFNFQSSLGYLTAEKNYWLMSTWCTVDVSQLDMDIMHRQWILYRTF